MGETAGLALPKHLEGEVDPDDTRAPRLDEFTEIAGSAGEVDDQIARADADPIERTATPALIHADGHDAVQRVISGRYAVEHVPHADALVFTGG